MTSTKLLHFVSLPPNQTAIYIRAMQFHADRVYTLVDDDTYAVMFAEEDTNDRGRYLFIKRDFGDSDESTCYIETHDRKYRGHLGVNRLEFTAGQLLVELNLHRDNLITVTFDLAPSKFAEVSRVIDIIRMAARPDLC